MLIQKTAVDLLERPLSEADERAAQASLPPPMLLGNYERRTSTCLLEKETASLVVEHQGFNLSDEGRNK